MAAQRLGIPDRQCRRLLSRYNQSGPLRAAPCFWPGHRAGSVAGYAADRCYRTAGLD
ncbi:TPA: hypothetical protein ACRX0K_001617 [Klebsiella pneumoniae]